MYRSCIYCTESLGSNDVVERFPVGRSMAFDGARGRLWAVCPRCARWNLAPLEERWGAMEDAERLFRDARVRAHRENIGLARLPDGTRLVRVGDALPAERAVWRYSRLFGRRSLGRALDRAVGWFNHNAVHAGNGAALASVIGFMFTDTLRRQVNLLGGARIVHRMPSTVSDRAILIRRWHLETATLAGDGAGGVELRFPYGLDRAPQGQSVGRLVQLPHALAIGGEQGRILLAKAVTVVNRAGARDTAVLDALDLLGDFRAPNAYVRWVADQRMPLSKGGYTRLDRLEDTAVLNRRGALALEMAVHEEHERRAMDGELAALREMWKQAEEIAAIADALPDVPPSDPPRIHPPR